MDKRHHELAPFQTNHASVLGERDTELGRIGRERENAENMCREITEEASRNIARAEQERKDKQAELLRQMTEYAMQNTREFDNQYAKALEPFRLLDEQKPQWDAFAVKAASFRPDPLFDKAKKNAEEKLLTKDYGELVQLAQGSREKLKPSSMPPFIAVLGTAAGLASVLACVMIFAADSLVPGIVLAAAVLAGIPFLYGKMTGGYIDRVLTYQTLCARYGELEAIKSRAASATEDLEVGKLREHGAQLYKTFIEADGILRKLEAGYKQKVKEIKNSCAGRRAALDEAFEAEKAKQEKNARKKIQELREAFDRISEGSNRRRGDIQAALDNTAGILAANEDSLSSLKAAKAALEVKIKQLGELAAYKAGYAAAQEKTQRELDALGGEEEDIVIPDPLYFFGGEYHHSGIEYISEFPHRYRTNVLLYPNPEKGEVVRSISKFLEKFLIGLSFSVDLGLDKKQYIIDVQGGSSRFGTSQMKEEGIFVIDEKTLDITAGKLRKENENCINALSELNCASFEELNAALKASRKKPLPFSILHIIVPKRDQIDNASRLLTSEFEKLIRADNDENGLLVFFYVSREEWYAPEVIVEKKGEKQEDIIAFIKKLASVDENTVYLIDDKTATLCADQ